MNMKFPILEYDPTRVAFIEPSKVIAPLDMPEYCVVCFFREVIDKVVIEHNAKVLVTDYWEDGPHPIYEIEYCDQRLAFFHPGVGAPLAAGLLEKVIAYSCRKFTRIWGQIFILDICPSLFCISLNLFPMPAHSATHVPLRGSYRLTRALGREKQI